MPYFDLKRAGTQYMFNLRGDNHETVLTSERYTAKQGALNGIAAVRANSSSDSSYARMTASTGYPYFLLRAANGDVIGVSEAYASNTSRDGGIEFVKKFGPWAAIKDLT